MPLNVGDKKEFLVPWGFLNPFLEQALYNNGFLEEDGYQQNPDFNQLKVLIKRTNDITSECPVNKKWVHGKNTTEFNSYINSIFESSKKFRQAYMAISMRAGDYICIRGKKNIIEQAWIFKINEPTDFKYVWTKHPRGENYRLLFTLEAVCSVPNNLYHKLQARRASIWKLNPDDENIVRNLIN